MMLHALRKQEKHQSIGWKSATQITGNWEVIDDLHSGHLDLTIQQQ